VIQASDQPGLKTRYDRFTHLSLRDSILIKGWAILIIVLHNFFHLIYRVTKENEMNFDPARFIALITETMPHPSEWVQGLFTYFGHFGVQLFICLSAYGMAVAHADATAGKRAFFVSRLRRIYPTFFLAVGMWLIFTLAWDVAILHVSLADELKNSGKRLLDVVKVALGIHNLFPDHGYPKVGPWWFIPFILQFYVLWALLGSRVAAMSRQMMLAIGLAGILFNYIVIPPVINAADVNLLYSPLGHIPEIMFGVYWARYGLPMSTGVVLAAAVAFVLSSLYDAAWPLHHIAALVLSLWAIFNILLINSNKPERLLYVFGLYSMPLFLVNGFLRPPFKAMALRLDTWYVDILAATVLTGVALAAAILVARTEAYLTRSIGRPVG